MSKSFEKHAWLICLILLMCSLITAQSRQAGGEQPGGAQSDLIVSRYSSSNFALTADPQAPQWKEIAGIVADRNSLGQGVAGHATQVRSRWTRDYLYFLFICPYEELNLKPDPSITLETNLLWNWDVAEVFIGTDFENIAHYTEFQVSPQGEFVDLDIRRKPTPAVHDWKWNSGFEVKARLDRQSRIWFGEMKIPMAKIDARTPVAGNLMRINFYRLQGPPPNRSGIAWRPTNTNSYHAPEAFGRLELGK